MKRIFIALLPLLLIGCADPFRETIAAFKKSEHMEKLTKCAGLTGKFEFKPFGQGDRNRYPEFAKEETPMLKITLEKEINGKQEPIRFFFAYNKQTYLFAAKGYATDNENLKYDDFCNPKENSKNEKKSTFPDAEMLAQSNDAKTNSNSDTINSKDDEQKLAYNALRKEGIRITSKGNEQFSPSKLIELNVADYNAQFKVADGFQVEGHDLVFIENERVIQFLGCCPNPGAVLTLRLQGDYSALENTAKNKGCVFKKPNVAEINSLLSEKKVSLLPDAKYVSLDCRENSKTTR